MGYSSGTKLYPREYLLYEPECVEVQSSCRCGAIAFWRRLADGEPRHRVAAAGTQSCCFQPCHCVAAAGTQSCCFQPCHCVASAGTQSCCFQPRHCVASAGTQSCCFQPRHCVASAGTCNRSFQPRHCVATAGPSSRLVNNTTWGSRLWRCYTAVVANSSVMGSWREVDGDPGQYTLAIWRWSNGNRRCSACR